MKINLKNFYGFKIKRISVGSFNVLPDPLKLFTVSRYPLFEQKCLCKMYTFMAEATFYSSLNFSLHCISASAMGNGVFVLTEVETPILMNN